MATTTNPLTPTRRRVSRALAGLELPAAFCLATVAAESRLLAVPADVRTPAQRRALRRVARQARALEGGAR